METAASLTRDSVLYLYGFVAARADLSGLPAVEQGADLFLVEAAGVACAVSVVPADAYQRPSGTMTAAEQLEWVTPRAWRHHEVLRRLHLARTVVPLKFGTLCQDTRQLEAMLVKLRVAVSDLLQHFEHRDEWTLKIGHDADALSLSLQSREPGLLALQAEASRLPDGRAYFVRKKLQRATADLAAARITSLEHEVRARVAELGIEIGPLRDDHGQVPLLVERHRFAALEATLAQLEDEYTSLHVSFELVGPWPPYSFTSVELTS